MSACTLTYTTGLCTHLLVSPVYVFRSKSVIHPIDIQCRWVKLLNRIFHLNRAWHPSQPPIYAVVCRPSSRALYCVCFLTEHPLSLDPLFRRNLWRLPPSPKSTASCSSSNLLYPQFMLVLSVTDQPSIHSSIPSFLHSDGLHAEQISDYSLVLIVVGDDGNTPVQSKGGLCLFPFADHSDQYIQTI